MSLTSYRAAPPRVKSMRFSEIRSSEEVLFALGRPGSDLLSRALRHSTIGAESFHGRVRNGIGCSPFATATRSSKRKEGLKSRARPQKGNTRLVVQRMSSTARNDEIKPIELLVPLS